VPVPIHQANQLLLIRIVRHARLLFLGSSDIVGAGQEDAQRFAHSSPSFA
jgi:hypothetical protein